MGALIFFKQNKKRLLLVFTIILCLSVIMNYFTKTTFNQYYDYYMPPKSLITYFNQFSDDEQVYQIANYGASGIEDTVTNVRGLDLADIYFIKDNSIQMKDNVQSKLNVGTKGLKQTFGYIYDSQILNTYQINVPLKSIDLDHLVIGHYPLESEMLISEEFATELISTSDSLKKYSDLIGFNYNGYNVSGIYAPSYYTIGDEIIIQSQEEPEDMVNLVLDYSQTTLSTLKNEGYDYIDSNYYNKLNYSHLVEVIFILIAFVVTFACIRNQVYNFRRLSKINNVNVIKMYINLWLPFACASIIIFFVFTIF